jgi:hypothetical protein
LLDDFLELLAAEPGQFGSCTTSASRLDSSATVDDVSGYVFTGRFMTKVPRPAVVRR